MRRGSAETSWPERRERTTNYTSRERQMLAGKIKIRRKEEGKTRKRKTNGILQRE